MEPKETFGLRGMLDYGTALYRRDDADRIGRRDAIALDMARNACEGVQYLLTADRDVSGLSCRVTAADGAGHVLPGQVFVAWYTMIRDPDAKHNKGGYTPVAILPLDDPYQGGAFDVTAGKVRTLFVRFRTKADTVPGLYRGKLEILRGGETLLSGEITVRVRSVLYADAPACITMIGLSYEPGDDAPGLRPGPAAAKPLQEGADDALWQEYAEFLLDNRMTPSDIPFTGGITAPGAVEYLKDPRVTKVYIRDKSDMAEPYRIAKENGLLDKLLFCYYDEPMNEGNLRYVLECERNQQKVFPTRHFCDPFFIDLPEDGKNTPDRMAEVTDTFCTKAELFKGSFRDSMLKYKKERGDTLLWYVCMGGTPETINRLPCTPGTDKRLLFWQQYQQEVDGFLYWRATFWNNHKDTWAKDYVGSEPEEVIPWDGDRLPTDDGVMLYWHPTTSKPVSTLGFEAMRAGIEDFELLTMADKAFGREKIKAIVEEITTDPAQYLRYEEGSTEKLESLRTRLFDLLENA